MIRNFSRAFWFGASDTRYIMGNWGTDTFRRFWLVKLGRGNSIFTGNRYMKAGTCYEHRILRYLGISLMDRQVTKTELCLRVNLDGEDEETIYEVKTQREQRVTRAHWQQCQVEMFATGKKLALVSYRMTEEDYGDYTLPIQGERLSIQQIAYDPVWIEREYLPRLRYLAKCLEEREVPKQDGWDPAGASEQAGRSQTESFEEKRRRILEEIRRLRENRKQKNEKE